MPDNELSADFLLSVGKMMAKLDRMEEDQESDRKARQELIRTISDLNSRVDHIAGQLTMVTRPSRISGKLAFSLYWGGIATGFAPLIFFAQLLWPKISAGIGQLLNIILQTPTPPPSP